jgi:MFS family permease
MSFLLAFNALLFAFAPDWKWLIAASIINSLALVIRQPAFNSLIADSTEEKSRAQSYALWSIIPPLFGFASPYLMGVYMDKHGALSMIRIGYIALFTGSSIASILRYRFLEETLREPEELVHDCARAQFEHFFR